MPSATSPWTYSELEQAVSKSQGSQHPRARIVSEVYRPWLAAGGANWPLDQVRIESSIPATTPARRQEADAVSVPWRGLGRSVLRGLTARGVRLRGGEDAAVSSIPAPSTIAGTLLVVVLVAALGLGLGRLRLKGVGLGVAGVLFAGLVIGHLGFAPGAESLELLRDLGLLLFVYAIGAQVGPGFVQTLRHGGLSLNALALAVVALGAGLCALLTRLLALDVAGMVGVFSGATTNTPSLGAAQQVLDGLTAAGDPRRGTPSLGYAVAYPFGVLGIIGALLLLRAVLRVDPRAESQATLERLHAAQPPVEHTSMAVENKNLDGMAIAAIPGAESLGVVISRIRRAGEALVGPAHQDTILHLGDTILAVGARPALESLRVIVGRDVTVDLSTAPGPLSIRRVVVTRPAVVRSELGALMLESAYDVTVTRLRRNDVEMTARSTLSLCFGDILQMVGRPADLDRAAALLGNSDKALGVTELLPVFIGLALGVVLGSWPFHLGGMPAPLRLGLAGGPLLVAIVLGRIGRIGPVVWYVPGTVNLAMRELGMSLFMAAVGLKAGAHVLGALRSGEGLYWLGCGALITLVPVMLVGLLGRWALKLDFATLAGVLAGSMTDPPALAFAHGMSGSDAPSLAYAAVYPATMLLRIVAAQLLVLLFS